MIRSMQKLVESQFYCQLQSMLPTRLCTGSKRQQLLFETFGRPLQEESAWRCTRQEDVLEASGARQHDVKVQPPILICLWRRPALMAPAINDDATMHGAPLAGSSSDHQHEAEALQLTGNFENRKTTESKF